MSLIHRFRKEFSLESISSGLEIQNEYHRQELKKHCAAKIFGKAGVIAKVECASNIRLNLIPFYIRLRHT